MRYLMTFSYDGSKYNGYQRQPNKKTIQGELEGVLTKINSNERVTISASGRTDALVHALNQKAHFDLNKDINEDRLKSSVNSLISPYIHIKSIEKVPDNFHARFNVKYKEYIYKINIGEYNPIDKDYIFQYNKLLDIENMKKSLKFLEGTHNFKSFVKSDTVTNDYVRTIIDTDIILNDNLLTIYFKGTGFMRYMVRNMVGYLIEVGEGKHNFKDILSVLDKEDRKSAGITAPACGLYLKDVYY